MKIRDRIKELRRVVASELVPHPKNWRKHTDEQRAAVRAVLREIGYADVILTRELPSGQLQIIDGHLRADLDSSSETTVAATNCKTRGGASARDSLGPTRGRIAAEWAALQFRSRSLTARRHESSM